VLAGPSGPARHRSRHSVAEAFPRHLPHRLGQSARANCRRVSTGVPYPVAATSASSRSGCYTSAKPSMAFALLAALRLQRPSWPRSEADPKDPGVGLCGHPRPLSTPELVEVPLTVLSFLCHLSPVFGASTILPQSVKSAAQEHGNAQKPIRTRPKVSKSVFERPIPLAL